MVGGLAVAGIMHGINKIKEYLNKGKAIASDTGVSEPRNASNTQQDLTAVRTDVDISIKTLDTANPFAVEY